MCQLCLQIDERVERCRQLLRSTTDPLEVECINRLIEHFYADRARLHRNPER
jgi:hypothetical protein